MPTVKYSVSAYIADGTTTDYLVTWDYLDDDHITVEIDGLSNADPTASHTFTKLNDTTVRVTDGIGGAIAAGKEIQLRRSTPITTRPISFSDGSALLAADLNKNSDYLLYSMQEALDQVDFSVQYQEEAEGFRDATQALRDETQTFLATVQADEVSADNHRIAAALSETNAAASVVTNTALVSDAAASEAAAQVSATNAAGSAVTAATQAALATTNGEAQVTLATTQAALATTNGAAQVTLATTQATNSATSASESAVSAAASLASYTASNGKAVEALASANNAASSATAAASSEAAAVAASSSVNSNITAINTVNSNITSINTVSGSIANVNVVAGNITSVNAFGNQYEVSASEPSSPNEGLLWFDTATDTMKVYNGNSFQNAGSSVNGTSSRGSFTATAGQTSFATTGYDSGYLDVYMNGVKLIDGTDFTATDGTNFVLTTGAALDDTLDYVAYGTFNLADVYTKTVSDARYYTQTASDARYLQQTQTDALYLPLTGGTISTDLIVTGNLTVNGTQTIVNSTTLDVADLNITIANGAADAAAANGAGLTVDGAAATILYQATGDKWAFNKPISLGTWTVTESGGSLYFSAGGVNKMKLDASGNLDVAGSVNTNATIT